uniref:CST complex subunit TEN1 n=1 Tax=Bubo bubo TaxID=30461 RepID=A0A8C0EI23_BUBBB
MHGVGKGHQALKPQGCSSVYPHCCTISIGGSSNPLGWPHLSELQESLPGLLCSSWGPGQQGKKPERKAAQQRLCEMLPSAGVYYFPWEINSSVPEGEALRTFGRLCCYDLVRSEAVLTAQHSSAQYRVCVDTKFVEPFQAQLGSCYIVLGEAEHREESSASCPAPCCHCKPEAVPWIPCKRRFTRWKRSGRAPMAWCTRPATSVRGSWWPSRRSAWTRRQRASPAPPSEKSHC